MKTLPLVIFQLLTTFHTILNQRLVNTTITIPKTDSYRITFRIGNGNMTWNKAIDQENDFTWVYHKEYNESFFPTSTKVSTCDSGLIYEDLLSFFNSNTTTIPHFPYYVIENATAMSVLHLGSFGFGFKYQNESNSIVHQLYNNNYTDHLSYSFVVNEDNHNGLMYFGGIPNEIKDTMKSGICYVNPLQSKWECWIKRITIGSFVFDTPSPLIFQAAEEPLYAPQGFMSKLMNHVFDNLIKDKLCSIVILQKKETIKCLTETVKTLPMISFTIDMYIYFFNATDFFEDSGQYSYLNILTNPYSNDTWIFSASFLKHFNALFDYENNYVQLFSNTKITRIKLEKIIMYYANGGLTIVGILLLIIGRIAFNKDLRLNKQ